MSAAWLLLALAALAATARRAAALCDAAPPSSMLAAARSLVPALSLAMHKGQAGRVGVLGGSFEYTGAPFYAAMAALRAGADLACIFCAEHASLPIKSYSPELIVYPRLIIEPEELSRLSSVVAGPGLGRAPAAMDAVSSLVAQTIKSNLTLVLDGDALWWLNSNFKLLKGYSGAIITPNAAEFDRLYRAAFAQPSPPLSDDLASPDANGLILNLDHADAKPVAALANWLGGVTVVRKGRVDIISDGKRAVACGAFGSPRRCGGQGDVLAGLTALFGGWARASASRSLQEPDFIAAAYGACVTTRRANALAFASEGRSMTTPDMIKDKLGLAFKLLFDDSPAKL